MQGIHNPYSKSSKVFLRRKLREMRRTEQNKILEQRIEFVAQKRESRPIGTRFRFEERLTSYRRDVEYLNRLTDNELAIHVRHLLSEGSDNSAIHRRRHDLEAMLKAPMLGSSRYLITSIVRKNDQKAK